MMSRSKQCFYAEIWMLTLEQRDKIVSVCNAVIWVLLFGMWPELVPKDLFKLTVKGVIYQYSSKNSVEVVTTKNILINTACFWVPAAQNQIFTWISGLINLISSTGHCGASERCGTTAEFRNIGELKIVFLQLHISYFHKNTEMIW